MRRFVAALVMVMVAASLAACGGGTSSGTSTTATAAVPAAGAAVEESTPVNPDSSSPTQAVLPYKPFEADRSQVPTSVLDKLASKTPFILYWYDPTTQVTKDQNREIDAMMPKYRGLIELESIDYTQAISDGATNAVAAMAMPSSKYALMTGMLKVTTTPYIVFVDRFGRITYRYAGFADRYLLEREILRATQ